MQLLQQVMGDTSGTSQPAGGTSAAAPGAGGTATPQQPPAQPPQPEVYKSPPQIMELYQNMMKYQNRTGMIDNGIGLIASAFAHPENRAGVRQALMAGSSAGSGAGTNDPMKFIGSIMEMQQKQKSIKDRSERRKGVAAIAETHGLDVPTAEFLFDNDQLDEVLSALSKPDNQIVQQQDGTHVIVNKTTGEIGQSFGPAKKRDIEIRTDDRGNQFAIYKDTGERVGEDNLVEGTGASTMEREWTVANEQRAEKGQPPIAFEDYVHQRGRSGAGSPNLGPNGIDYGDAPTDMAWSREKDGSIKVDENGAPVAVPIVGSKLWAEQQAANDKKKDRKGQKAVVSGFIDQSIDDSLKLIKPYKDTWLPGVTGFSGTIAKYVPGTESRTLSNNLETLKANLGFEKLQQMREASPTGGALGQVSDFENRLLQSTFGALDQGGDDDVLVRNLFRIQFMADAIVNGYDTGGGRTNFKEDDPEGVRAAQKDLFKQADEAADAWLAEGRSEEDLDASTDPEVQALIDKHLKDQ